MRVLCPMLWAAEGALGEVLSKLSPWFHVSNCDIMLTNIGDRRILRPMEVNVEKLIRLREDRVLSQRDLARMAGLSQGTVWRLENGFAEAYPSTIRKLAEALGVEPRDLVRREG